MKYLISLLCIILVSIAYSQTTLINQAFSSTSPAGWSSTLNTWTFNYNGTATSNYRSASWCARFSSAVNGNTIYMYIPVTFKYGYTYNVTFYTKRACSITVNSNETANQTTLLSTSTLNNADCASNWNAWYEWNFSVPGSYNGAGFLQIKINTVYGGPASVYLDDFGVTETAPTALPIELLYFNGKFKNNIVVLNWATASETHNAFFSIEKGFNGIDFGVIDRLEGFSHSDTVIHYEFHDDKIIPNVIYYRLKQTDLDGNYTYIDPIAVDCGSYIVPEPIRYINVLGQPVDPNTPGLLIEMQNGIIQKKVIIPVGFN